MKRLNRPGPWIAATLLLACGTPPEESPEFVPVVIPDAPPPAEPHPGVHEFPWTDEFDQSALLLADEVVIEGPQGLLQHTVCRQDNQFHTRTEQSLPEGYLQEIVINAPDAPEIRCQMNGLQIVALRRLRLLESPGRDTVVVRARGNAYWKVAASGAEKRGDLLEFTGEVEE